jgi:tetratricopeptide (TPR) repeat protein
MLQAQPALRAQLLHAFGDVQRRFTGGEDAAPLLEEAVAELDAAFGSESSQALAARDSLAQLLAEIGRTTEAVDIFRWTHEVRVRALGADAPDTLRSLSRLGFWLWRSHRPGMAEPLLARCASGMARTMGPDHPETIVVAAYHIGVLLDLERFQEVLDGVSDLLPRAEEVLGIHVETNGLRFNRACALAAMGRSQESLQALREAVDAGFFLGYHRLAEEPTLTTLRGLPGFAEIARRASLNSSGNWPLEYAECLRLRAAGRYREAAALLDEIRAAAVRIGVPRTDTFDLEYSHADLLFLEGRPEEAEPIVARLYRQVKEAPWRSAYPSAELAAFAAQCRLVRGDRAGAIRWLNTAASELSTSPHLAIAAYVESRRRALAGDRPAAERLLDEARARELELGWFLPRDALTGS